MRVEDVLHLPARLCRIARWSEDAGLIDSHKDIGDTKNGKNYGSMYQQ